MHTFCHTGRNSKGNFLFAAFNSTPVTMRTGLGYDGTGSAATRAGRLGSHRAKERIGYFRHYARAVALATGFASVCRSGAFPMTHVANNVLTHLQPLLNAVKNFLEGQLELYPQIASFDYGLLLP